MTPTPAPPTPPTVKCLVWDLDDTLWDGTVLEGDEPVPFPAAVATLRALDERGILHAVASRGDHDTAVRHLRAHGLDELFTVLEIGWGSKSAAVGRIAAGLGIGTDTVAFADNDPLERAEVASVWPEVRTYTAESVADLPEYGDFRPGPVTPESRARRLLYRREALRTRAREDHTGPPEEFLASLRLVLTIRRAEESDLERAGELTVRTHQLNTTGRTYGVDRLRELCHSPRHEVFVAELTDRFGSYGTIGLTVTALDEDTSTLRLLLLSCRVMSRGVGPALLRHLVREALAAGRRPVAEFVPTPVNRAMLVNLRFCGYEVTGRTPERLLLAYRGTDAPPQDGPVRVVSRTEVPW
ncbi:HAD-IIIC family phosphatase [Streptomyces sp. NPDC057638]|uniref:HAD-IIIC family phosphatase n=1 Tax=Streptomyces sp. NPDC057638 TaxID=3346190 RepID=UPI0036887D60